MKDKNATEGKVSDVKIASFEKKPYKKPVIQTEQISFEMTGVCIKSTPASGNPCRHPRKS